MRASARVVPQKLGEVVPLFCEAVVAKNPHCAEWSPRVCPWSSSRALFSMRSTWAMCVAQRAMRISRGCVCLHAQIARSRPAATHADGSQASGCSLSRYTSHPHPRTPPWSSKDIADHSCIRTGFACRPRHRRMVVRRYCFGCHEVAPVDVQRPAGSGSYIFREARAPNYSQSSKLIYIDLT